MGKWQKFISLKFQFFINKNPSNRRVRWQEEAKEKIRGKYVEGEGKDPRHLG